MKQTRAISGQGYSEEDRKTYVSAVHQSLLLAIQSLVLGMEQLSIKYENPANEKVWKQTVDVPTHTPIDSEEYSLISQLWSDSGVHNECYGRRREFDVPAVN
ncbi:guanine nucleotide-binding protein G(q) subunit alpha-like [Dysidea avara]|uniref:guanine nucleotide-binding protein G(q) subunit alpha-like n=1 Tax=Dysidea avara TaxID=196820 RepID=UPI00331E7250